MLSRAMFMDVLAALDATKGITHIAVLTSDKEVAALADQLGHEVIQDNSDGQLCDGLNEAARHIADQGAAAMLMNTVPSLGIVLPAAIWLLAKASENRS